MLLSIALGCVLMVVTTFIHNAGMVLSLRVLQIAHADRWAARSRLKRASVVSVPVLVMFMAALIEGAIWGVTYVAVGAISNLG